MAQSYTATAKQNPGRKSWLVEFRHPLRSDGNDKAGKKTRKGLGTPDAARAQLLVSQLNELLADRSLWSLGAKPEAVKRYEPEVVEIFYGEIEPRAAEARPLRDKLLPLPARSDGYAKVVLMGVPGAGKTTLVRQLMGTHPENDRFPSTSVNRTTTFPTEVVLQAGEYRAAVTFMSEHETRFEIEECVSAAIVEAVEGGESQVTRALLEKSDMRFRLKYLLGDLAQESDEVDPYDEVEAVSEEVLDDSAVTTDAERTWNAGLVRGYVNRIFGIAKTHQATIEAQHGALAAMLPGDRSAALDLIEDLADASDEFLELVSDILEELRGKFELLAGTGQFEKTTTGWPKAWTTKEPADRRDAFLKTMRFLSGIALRSWGKLLTPLVNGLRVQGPFRPTWAPPGDAPRFILMDTEGLGHKATATADLSDQAVALLHEADVILLVESAKSGMTNYAAGKALESVVNVGHTRKLSIVFTHMDTVKGDNLKGQAKLDHVFLGLRNVIDNQLAKSVSAEAARFLLERLADHTFYVGRIDAADAKPAFPELLKLLTHLMAEQPPVIKPVSFPQYSSAHLMLVIQEAARDFRKQWQGFLNIAPDAVYKPKSWQSLKALTRRYAEGWGETYELRPAANLRTALELAASRFLESPISWSGEPTPDQQRDAIERLKSAVAQKLPELTRKRLREQPQLAWQGAWLPRGTGSTSTRRILIEGIYERWVPVPDARGDQTVVEFMAEIEHVVQEALAELEAEVKAK